MKNKTLKFKTYHLLFITLLLAGCTEPPIPTLNGRERSLVDSLYKDTINYLLPKLDSICEVEFNGRVQAAVDSMMTKRMGEIEKQLNRIRQFEKQQEDERNQ